MQRVWGSFYENALYKFTVIITHHYWQSWTLDSVHRATENVNI